MTADDGGRTLPERSTSNLRGHLVDPVFVGGTGRSGTTVTARLLGASSAVHVVPIEIRFHVDPGGLADLIEERVGVSQFLNRMKKQWYRRSTPDGQTRGLHLVVDEGEWMSALEAFEDVGDEHPIQASRYLLGDLLDPLALRQGASRWVEMTPPNVLKMKQLVQVYPQARFVHVYRDGRDVAHSVASMGWGPNDFSGALAYWERTFVEGLEEMRGIEESVLVVSMENLVLHDRDQTAQLLFDFVGESLDSRATEYFDRQVSADRAHIGRWSQGTSSGDQRRVNAQYEAALDRIHGEFPAVTTDLRMS